jgi:hypothetical protein
LVATVRGAFGRNPKQTNTGRMINKWHGEGAWFIGFLGLLLKDGNVSKIILFMPAFSRPTRFSKYAELRTNRRVALLTALFRRLRLRC